MEGKALGKGLSALIPEETKSQGESSVSFIDTDLIFDNKRQPRVNYNEEKMQDLKSSISYNIVF